MTNLLRKFKAAPLACLLLLYLYAMADAQQRPEDSARPAAGNNSAASSKSNQTQQEQARTSADESFDLNIAERRITRRDFEASTSVAAGEESARGLKLRVGVAVGADRIDVLLRNVRGRVRFRATLDRVLQRINSRRSAGPAP